MSALLTDERREQMERVLSNRTRYFTVVLEDLFQPQNASAILRSCDCFGVQDVHIIENRNEFTINPEVVMGADKWLDVYTYNTEINNTESALKSLKHKGYKIIATSPHTNDVNLEEFDYSDGKCAFVFGTELTGISQTVKDQADAFLKIPMYGFTESLNISVSVAIALHHLCYSLRASNVSYNFV